MEFTVVSNDSDEQTDIDAPQYDLTVKCDYPYVYVTGVMFSTEMGSITIETSLCNDGFRLIFHTKNSKIFGYPLKSKKEVDTACQNLKDCLNTFEKEKREKQIIDSQVTYNHPFISVLGVMINCSKIDYDKLTMKIEKLLQQMKLMSVR